VERKEVRCEVYRMDDAEYAIAAYGTTARIAKTAIQRLRAEGLKVGLIRPITLWPFPYAVFREWGPKIRFVLDVEMSMGQMIQDVRIGVGEQVPVHFYGRVGGMVPTPGEIVARIRELAGQEAA